ncbi:putative lysine-specific demethylase JMJ16 isoform X1 [Prunus yedoensis var. nudiflora]|uniref:Putative lysine-specific demethylase JMJ16 isoform X1 n=1 Tax=Prunus yedoensis var. nudiflora TaxID=2094558 RepID=A0A314UG08_PRUYE|nr:putative lysine-specific demethylase JMJ16 isoform X1 [Prunus yedoensis var. nudiflora]
MAFNSVPPGFASRTSFVLKRMEKVEETNGVNASKQEPIQMDSTSDLTDMDKLKRSLQHRPWILFDQRPPAKTCLPKGVTHGCPDCSDCLKVTGRWRPEDARIDVLEEAPVFHPTEEEFKDMLKYIATIRARAEQYGICRIVPPPSWKPQCLIKEYTMWKRSTFSTHIQRIDGLRNQSSPSKMVGFYESTKKKRRRILRVGLDSGSTSSPGETGHSYVKGFEPEPGREFTLENFERYAADFKIQYFCKSEVRGRQDKWVPSLENIEAEYKLITENPTEEIEVLCGDNLETKALGSGFPTVSKDSNPLATSDHPEYLASGWNLNNLPRLPGSLLSFESHDTCNILVPQARVGMCFSSFHWKVEEHHLYSLAYTHLGAPKIWYGVPGKYSVNFEAAMRSSFSESSSEHPELRNWLVKQLPPSTLKSQGIPVFRCIQSPGEFVLEAVELYCEQGRKTSISHDKLLLGAAREAVRAQWDSLFRKNTSDNFLCKDDYGKDGILTHVFKSRLSSEALWRKYLCNSSQSRRMKSNFDATSKKECSICLRDLHFSAAFCPCSADRYSCLLHAKQLCSCAWSDKVFLYRHRIDDLYLLLDALEGKLDAVFKWGKDDLGLALHVHHQKNIGHVDGPTSNAEKTKPKESMSQDAISAELKARMLQSIISRKLKANDHPSGTLDAATVNVNDTNSVSSILAKVKAHVLQSTILNEQKAKENTLGPTITPSTRGNNAPSLPTEAMKGTNNTPLPLTEAMEETSDVSSVSTSETSSSDSQDLIPDLDFLFRGKEQAACPLEKGSVPGKLSKGGHPANNGASSSPFVSENQTSRQAGSQSGIVLLSDDSDG